MYKAINGYYLIRVAYVFVCWGILFLPIRLAEVEPQLLTALMLFYLPLGLDYWTHQPKNSDDEKRKYIGIILPAFLFCLFLIFLIINSEVHSTWLLKWYLKYPIWLLSGFFVWLALRDFISYSTDEEEESRIKTRDSHRVKAEGFRTKQEQRKAYYQKGKTKQFLTSKPRSKSKGGKKK